MILSNAHRKAITSALFIPIIESIIEYSINSIVICTEMPMKYLESNILIFEIDDKKFFLTFLGRILLILVNISSPSFMKKKVINSIDNRPTPMLPTSEII
jgi:hypothetical protein